jgi:hypothetical protein
MHDIQRHFAFSSRNAHLHGLEGLHIEQVVAIIKRRLLIIERWKSHTPEVPTVTLFSAHHDPHGAPLRHIYWLYDLQERLMSVGRHIVGVRFNPNDKL